MTGDAQRGRGALQTRKEQLYSMSLGLTRATAGFTLACLRRFTPCLTIMTLSEPENAKGLRRGPLAYPLPHQ